MLLEIDDKTWKDICEDNGFKYLEDHDGGYYTNSMDNPIASIRDGIQSYSDYNLLVTRAEGTDDICIAFIRDEDIKDWHKEGPGKAIFVSGKLHYFVIEDL